MAALAASGLTGLPARAEGKTLVVPTLGGVWEQFWRSTVAPEFSRQSGAEVTLDVGNGRVFGANLRAAGVDKPPYSIVMTNEVFASGLRKEGFFEKLDLSKVPNYADLYPLAKQTDGWGAIGAVSPIGIGYRTDLVKTPPKSWKDLWNNPEFAGRIGLYNFANSAGKMELLLFSKILARTSTTSMPALPRSKSSARSSRSTSTCRPAWRRARSSSPRSISARSPGSRPKVCRSIAASRKKG